MEQKKDGLAACGGCTAHEHKAEHQPVPYIVHERDIARMERMNRRLWILCIVLIVLLAVTNGAWLYYENQFIDEVTVTQENGDGYNNYVDGDGTINN